MASRHSAPHRVLQACETLLRVFMYAASFPVLCLQRGPAAMHASRPPPGIVCSLLLHAGR